MSNDPDPGSHASGFVDNRSTCSSCARCAPGGVSGRKPRPKPTEIKRKILERFAKIESGISLDKLRLKIVTERIGGRWSDKRLDLAILRYKRFLAMATIKGVKHQIVPTMDIDRIWHQHIQDTRGYAKDCDSVCGGFLDHDPYLGLEPKSKKKLFTGFAKTARLYQYVFGDPYEIPSQPRRVPCSRRAPCSSRCG